MAINDIFTASIINKKSKKHVFIGFSGQASDKEALQTCVYSILSQTKEDLSIIIINGIDKGFTTVPISRELRLHGVAIYIPFHTLLVSDINDLFKIGEKKEYLIWVYKDPLLGKLRWREIMMFNLDSVHLHRCIPSLPSCNKWSNLYKDAFMFLNNAMSQRARESIRIKGEEFNELCGTFGPEWKYEHERSPIGEKSAKLIFFRNKYPWTEATHPLYRTWVNYYKSFVRTVLSPLTEGL